MCPPSGKFMPINWQIEHYDELGSTSTVAMECARGGMAEGLVVVAGQQTAGRGQFERNWVSPLGGLSFSCLLRPKIAASNAAILSPMTLLAVFEVLERYLPIQLKPPNDLYSGGRKFGGILIETDLGGQRINHAIIGVGLNVNFSRELLPDELDETATTIFDESGRIFSLDKLLDELLAAIDKQYQRIHQTPDELHDDYFALMATHHL